MLHGGIIRFAARIAQGKVGEYKTGNAALLYDIPRRAEYHRWQTVLFKVSSDQTHGLVTHRSKRNEQHGIDAIRAALVEDCRGIAIDRLTLAVVGFYAVEAWREAADTAVCGILL